MTLLEHAQKEIDILKKNHGQDFVESYYNNILKIIKIFSEEGHSGTSAQLATKIIYALLQFKPLSPIENRPQDWTTTAQDKILQHNRCSNVFKEGNKAWILEGSSKESITFPYTVRI